MSRVSICDTAEQKAVSEFEASVARERYVLRAAEWDAEGTPRRPA